MRNPIRDFMRDAQQTVDPGDYDSNGMVKLYLKHGPPVSGWVDHAGDDGIITFTVAVDNPNTTWRDSANDRYLTGDYPLQVLESEVAAFRFTDIHEFCNRSKTSY